ncbi:MAG TPA: PIG-L family deacetylase [bacterium]|nr:PIG-L family deacetylase [bacterium]
MKELQISASARILVLAPHPDDESMGCGGLLLKHPGQCEVIVLTDGRHGGLSGQDQQSVVAMRKSEFEKAMAYALVKRWFFLGVEDGKLSDNFEKFAKLDLSGYDFILCPFPGENHQDHACVFDFLRKVKTQTQCKILGYEVWSTLSSPSHYIDISDVVNNKKRLIAFYKSQIVQVDYVAKVIGLNCFRGLLPYPAVKYAEAYQEL